MMTIITMEKCAKAGCDQRREPLSIWCIDHQGSPMSTTCDDLPAISEDSPPPQREVIVVLEDGSKQKLSYYQQHAIAKSLKDTAQLMRQKAQVTTDQDGLVECYQKQARDSEEIAMLILGDDT